MTLYAWPRAAAYGRAIPKSKIYEKTGASTALKDLFVREVDQIIWLHKLAPETINLPATEKVPEIQVLRILARTELLSEDVLRAIDRAIPLPLIFEIGYGERVQLAAAYKRPAMTACGEVDATHWVLSDYYASDWESKDAPRAPLPVSLNLAALYENLLSPLVKSQTDSLVKGVKELPPPAYGQAVEKTTKSLEERIAVAEAVKAKAREIERIKVRLSRERQFNKRVEINAELRATQQELAKLLAGGHGATRRDTQEERHG